MKQNSTVENNGRNWEKKKKKERKKDGEQELFQSDTSL